MLLMPTNPISIKISVSGMINTPTIILLTTIGSIAWVPTIASINGIPKNAVFGYEHKNAVWALSCKLFLNKNLWIRHVSKNIPNNPIINVIFIFGSSNWARFELETVVNNKSGKLKFSMYILNPPSYLSLIILSLPVAKPSKTTIVIDKIDVTKVFIGHDYTRMQFNVLMDLIIDKSVDCVVRLE